MRIIFFRLLILQLGWCASDENFSVKTVGVGGEVTLSCSRNASGKIGSLFWIRFVAGKLPEILGRGFSFDYDGLNRISRIATRQEPGKFVLQITKTEPTDTAFYYCLKSERHNVTFLKGIFLRIKGPEPVFTSVFQDSPSDAAYVGDLVTLQCSVLSEPRHKTCPEDSSVYWFRVASGELHPSLIYAQSSSDGECEKTPESQPLQSCVFSFVKENVSSSDAGNYYCAVAACGMMVFGNGTKLDIGAARTCDSEKNNTFFLTICASLAISLSVTAFLVCAIRRNVCYCCKASMPLQANDETISGEQENQLRGQESAVYSEDVFFRRKSDRAERRKAKAKEETTVIYSHVRFHAKH